MISANPTYVRRTGEAATQTQARPELTRFDAPATLYTAWGKRLFDVAVALCVTVFILSWMIPLLGLLIRLSSPGPVLFVQVRSGRNGRVFHCLKFRTMYHAPTAAFVQTRRNDARVTKLGAFLRRTNLDEMPQFWNVLMGDMSVVGPRPHAVQHDDQYWHVLHDYRARYQVRPGITGLAQVRGARGETDALIKMKHRVQYDLLYVRRQSVGLDVKICLNTLRLMVGGKDKNAF